jgi:hypothetical protein
MSGFIGRSRLFQQGSQFGQGCQNLYAPHFLLMTQLCHERVQPSRQEIIVCSLTHCLGMGYLAWDTSSYIACTCAMGTHMCGMHPIPLWSQDWAWQQQDNILGRRP